ncbi:MAG: T9SS type A sorting domain-containing protein [Fluviicola sp.]
MKNLVFLLLFFPFFVFAQPYAGEGKPFIPKKPKGASCAPANAKSYLEYNNVRALIHTGGNIWQIPGQNLSQYEIPKNSGIHAFFTSALWMGGTDVNGQLKLAALRYRDGNDYWTGPLTETSAEIDPSECYKYDKHFASSQDLVREFDAWYAQGLLDQQNGTNLQNELFPNYQVPSFVKDWPAHGDISKGQDYYLAPFYDRDLDGDYDWTKGDYPWYDITLTKECTVDRKVSLYGDYNLWWVMNDKGNIHTESGGEPIGMEIRAQAFAFATNDDVNQMTFYNYELINRGTQTLYDTYFGIFIDGALGNPFDDYVGCDVQRGLGYVYNGNAYDADNNGFRGYGNNPPAAGVDFFEGPYQDNDSIDNAYGIGPNEALNGIGYGDGIPDNERFGMRRFLYYINSGGGANPNQTDPTSAAHYYNFLRGRWKDNTPFYYGGSGHISDPEANTSVPCDFMFPGDTDPLGWGTGGNPQPLWTEQTANNQPFDRRFVQSAGPFILTPGAVNNITVGMVWARSTSGDPFESVEALRIADDKAQALFENCFRVLEGPHAPDLTGQELENEVILYLDNQQPSNNQGEEYKELDPFIATALPNPDKYYRFQGYLIYQLKNDKVSAGDLFDPTKARLVGQCDVKDSVDRLVNFEQNDDLGTSIPALKVDGENKGIKHSFRITQDAFATGDTRLINFKRYYYMAIAYAHNSFKKYDPTDPSQLDGQKMPFLGSRKSAIGEVRILEMIPHNPMPEQMGTAHFASYGFQPEITRIDGIGNGLNEVDITENSEAQILANGSLDRLTYQANKGPIQIKVIDPLNVVDGYFQCKINDYGTNPIDSASYTLYRYDFEGGTILDSIQSDKTIHIENEQIIPQWGISVSIKNENYYEVSGPDVEYRLFAEPITSTISFANASKPWLTTFNDVDSYTPENWILSGPTPIDTNLNDPSLGVFNPVNYADFISIDPEQKYEKLLDGGISHFSVVGANVAGFPIQTPSFFLGLSGARDLSTIARASGVDIVFTNDRSKWTRVPIIELGTETSLTIGNAQKGTLRKSPSVDKFGNNDGSGQGMGWFPGYAIDVEKGIRLQMAFGENSMYQSQNGADMLWNPTATLADQNGNYFMGGQHTIYVFGENIGNSGCPGYDENNLFIAQKLATTSSSEYLRAYRNLMWVMQPRLNSDYSLLETEARVRVRINKEYTKYAATGLNNDRPLYGWSMKDYRTSTNDGGAVVSALDLINVVPNPYYAYSEYERNKVDTRVKITNLPTKCTVSIYTISGKLVERFEKDTEITFLDWKLTNSIGIPVASGIYLIHVSVPGVGERVIKSFIGMRQLDVQGF